MRRFLIVPLLLSCVACNAPLHGPKADLQEIAKPDPVPTWTPPPRPTPAPGPQASSGFFRAWIPRQTAPNGDTTDGHWQVISLTPPATEQLDPALPIPRAPHRAPERPKPPTVQVPLSQLPPGLVPPPQGQEPPPGLPPGMGWAPDAPRGDRYGR